MYWVFVTKTKHKPVSCDNGKIIVTEKEMSRLFWCGYLTAHYSMVAGKYFRNAEKCQKYCPNAENRLILNPQQGKNGGFDCYKESLTSMSNVYYYGSAGKSKFIFGDWWKINNVKEVGVEKLIQTLIFLKLASVHDILIRYIVVHIIIELFLHQRTNTK